MQLRLMYKRNLVFDSFVHAWYGKIYRYTDNCSYLKNLNK